MGDLCRRTLEVYHVAVERAEEGVDRSYLECMLNGTDDLMSDDVFRTIEPMFARYAEGSDMYQLLERASQAFGAAALEVARWALAGDDAVNIIERIRACGPSEEGASGD